MPSNNLTTIATSNHMRKWTDSTLLAHTKDLVLKEKSITANLIAALAEVDRRKLYVDLGHPSLFSYCVGQLKLSEGQAYRRIQAARLLREIPEVKDKIESGDVSLSALSKLADHFKKEKTNPEEKKELLTKIENKSNREVEKLTFSLKNKNTQKTQGSEIQPESKSAIKPEINPDKIKIVSETQMQITLTIDEETLQLLNKIKGQNLHKNLAGLGEVIKFVCQERDYLQNQTQKLQAKLAKLQTQLADGLQTNTTAKTPTTLAPSRHIPASVRRQVFVRAQHACEFEVQSRPTAWTEHCASSAALSASCAGQVNGAISGPNVGPRHWPKICGSKIGLEVDHIRPWSQGGTHEIVNLRLLCKAHHQRITYKTFGGWSTLNT